MRETIIIEQRFHGPPDSGNGGYVSGCLAKFIDGPAAVRLRTPPPLEVELEVRREDAHVVLVHDDAVVAQGRPSEVPLEAPDPASFAEAETASGRFRGFTSHWFPSCFVCGPHRDLGDGLRMFPGPVEGRDLVAAPWIPDASLGSMSGAVRPEFLWAALDCPGAFAFSEPANRVILLGELAVALSGTVTVGERCVLVAWEIDRAGRKHYTGTALFGETGSCCGVGLGTWFEVARDPGKVNDRGLLSTSPPRSAA